MSKVPTESFSEFIEFFPLLELPLNLLPDISQIPTGVRPLPESLVDTYIFPFEGEETDEFTEYVPYGKLPGPKDFHALIYWKASVMQYEFILATYSNAGKPLSHAIVGGLHFEGDGVLHSVAVIHEDLTITIAEGMSEENKSINLDDTNMYQMSIQSSGQISYGSNEENQED